MKGLIGRLFFRRSGKEPQRVALVLSGGGARAWAHIGLLKALEEEGIYPEVVSGVSAGAIVGAMYASGRSADETLEIVQKTDMFKILRKGLFSFMAGAFSSLGHLQQQLEVFLPDNSFGSLQRKLFITTVNLNTGRVEIFDSGELHKPIMASCAVPLLFAPVKMGEYLYADGGVLNNLPVEPLLGQGYKIIGSNVVSPSLNMRLDGFRSVSMRSFELVSYKGIEDKAGLCDVMLTYEGLENYNIFRFAAARQIVDLGYKSARKQMDLLLAKLK
ncbi:NTE family protein [Anseongella ginsenosidimutans]|uniref:NTE family protein n=1 Tax=Anseongella ginsenosidimutans TaxID=496056 RepID=A0A4R3KQM3_9SPHI|nr:patatin-like phospholipase family protein [Anseongella ginsenosidimutans]QEC52322.1 patatin-like phospholipase family protein [Anseongella ginsenosidimutans]TCS86887.1 NTE family protein [Anseongella ginsenosidimutans]